MENYDHVIQCTLCNSTSYNCLQSQINEQVYKLCDTIVVCLRKVIFTLNQAVTLRVINLQDTFHNDG